MSEVERFTGSTDAGVVLRARTDDGAALTLHLLFDGELLRGERSRPAGSWRAARRSILVATRRARGAPHRRARELARRAGRCVSLRAAGEVIEVETASGTDRHLATPAGWEIAGAAGSVRLAGLRRAARRAAAADRSRPADARRRRGAARRCRRPSSTARLDALRRAARR